MFTLGANSIQNQELFTYKGYIKIVKAIISNDKGEQLSETIKEVNSNCVTGTTNYGENFTSAIAKDKLFAVQFHPEKSQSDGLQLLKNFTNWA